VRSYRVVWTGAAALVVGCAAVLDIAGGGLLRMTLLGVGTGFFGAALAYAIVEERQDRWTWVRRALLWCAVGAVATDALEALTLRDLHRRWEWTTAEVLRPTTSVSRRVALVEERRHLLDELQLRDPVGFDAWLHTAVPDRRRARPWPPGL
jgi:hypothetical protein